MKLVPYYGDSCYRWPRVRISTWPLGWYVEVHLLGRQAGIVGLPR